MFAELHQLARAASLLISVAAEGDNLRVTVSATSTSKNGAAVHPLVLVGTPHEIDAGFAEAVQIFEPSALPLLDQARAAANANGNKGKAPSKDAAKPSAKSDAPASGTPAKRGPGRPTNAEIAARDAASKKSDASAGDENPDADDEGRPNTPEVDPRQMSLVDKDADSTQAGAEAAADEPATQAEQPATTPPAAPASTDPRDTGIDLPI